MSERESKDSFTLLCKGYDKALATIGRQESFTHVPLPEVTPSYVPIRLLRVLQAADGSISELQCELVTVNIIDRPSFRALSYVWGDASDVSPLILNDKRYHITKNCYAALKRYRDQAGWGLVWVDAICINQRDPAEKAIQIPLMRKIYSYAERVVVWLGCPNNEKTTITEHRERRVLALLEHLALIKSTDVDRILDFKTTEQDTSFEWGALIDFFQHRWFTRLWVHQEVGLAREAVIVTHHTTMPYQTFLDALETLRLFIVRPAGISHFKEIGWEERANSILWHAGWRSMAQQRLTLHSTLRLTKGFHCFDPHDCIFAILGLIDPEVASQIEIDYSTSLAQLFAQVTCVVIKMDQSLEIVAQVGCANKIQVADFPYWVVDWSQRPIPRLLEKEVGVEEHLRCLLYNAAPSLKPIASSSADCMELTLSGYLIDTIEVSVKSVHLFEPEGGSFPSILDPRHLNAWRARFSTYPTNCEPEEAWVRTILLDSRLGGYPHLSGSRLSRGAFQRYMAIYRSGPTAVAASDQNDAELQKDIARFEKFVNIHLKRRSFFITGAGFMGLGPEALEEGDIVCVVPGCSVPLLLRGRERHHILVGECFVWGLMDGEALEGRTEGDLTAFRIL